MKLPALLFLAVSLLSASTLRAQDISTIVAPNVGGSDNSVDIRNNSGGSWYFITDPSPSAARMAKVNGAAVTPWGVVGQWAPDPTSNVQNRLYVGESLRVYPKTLPVNSVITIPFRYGPVGQQYSFNITVVDGAQVTSIVTLDPTVTAATSVRWRVTFDRPIAGVTAANFAFSNPSFTSATVSGVSPDTASPSTSWTVTASVPNGLGDLGLNWAGHRTETPTVPVTFTGFTYTFAYLPFFTQQPASQGINRNTSVTLTANATLRDDPRPLFYQWYRGSQNTPSQYTPISGATSTSYTPPTFTSVGQTTYFCRAYANSPYTPSDSNDAVVTVVDPPQITQGLANGVFLGGSSPTLTVTATGTSLTYQWYRGSMGDTTNLLATTTTGSYVLSNVSQNASYWVRVSNAGPTVATSGASYRVVTTFDRIVSTLSTPINAAYPQPALFTIRDSAGAPVGGFPVRFTVQAGAGGASASFPNGQQQAIAIADANGVVAGPVFTANGTAGVCQLTADNGAVSTTFACTNLPTFNAATAAGLTTNAAAAPFNLAAATGAQSPGGTFSGPGVTGGNTFNPASAGTLGQKTLTYTVNGASATFSVLVNEAPRLVVDIAGDTVNSLDGSTSLREALVNAAALGGAQTITFAPALAGQTITLTEGWTPGYDGALVVNGTLTIDGGTGAPVTVALNSPGTPRRLILVGSSGFLTVRNLVLTGGDLRGANDGGAIWNSGRVDLVRTRLTGNKANLGGALINYGTLNATECTIDHNLAANEGGGFLQSSGTMTVTSSTFSNNQAGNGGAINSSAGLTISGSRFTANASTFNGGALRLYGTAAVSSSTFDGNSAANGGGAIISHGSLTLTNCTLAGNSAVEGGGLQCFEGSAALRFVTAAFNTASSFGGGVRVNSADVTGLSCLVAGNTAPSGADLAGSALNAASANNVLNLSAVAARIAPAADNGGGMPTVALLGGSPAIDAGGLVAGITVDQRGIARPQGAGNDSGAFERVPTAAVMPQFAVPGGAFDGTATVTLSTTSPSATIRYTLDGTNPTESNGSVYSGPFQIAESATVRAVAYGLGYTVSPVASAFFAVRSGLESWRAVLGLPADGSQDAANPSGDGVANLLKFAFNLASQPGDLGYAYSPTLAANGTAGLPLVGRDAQNRLTLTFVRRKAATRPGISYFAEASTDLQTWTTLDLAGASVTSIDATWERVVVTDPTAGAKRLGRVRVIAFTPYVNDFNAGLGAATLRGSAVWANQAIMLTDTVGGQQGALVLDGIGTGPWMGGFTARFNLAIGPAGQTTPADGVSFSVGELGSGAWGEGGPSTAQSLTVSFDTYDNGGDGSIGIRIKVGGVTLASNATNPFTNGASVPVEIRYDAATGLSMVFNGATIFNQVATSGFALPTGGKFGFGARTGGSFERAIIDDVRIDPR